MEEKKRFLIFFAYYACLALILFFGLGVILNYLMPFVVATAVALVSRLVSSKINTKINKDILSVIIVGLIYGLILLIAFFCFKSVLSHFRGALDYFLIYTKKAGEMLSRFLKSFKKDLAVYNRIIASLDGLTTKIFSSLSNNATDYAGKIPSLLLSFLVTVTASVYIAKDYTKLKKFIKGIIPQSIIEKTVVVKKITLEASKKLLFGYFLLFCITFFELSAAFLLLKVPYAVPLGFLVAIVDILPILGTGTVLIPWAVISFIGGKTVFGIMLILTYTVITVVRNFSEPHIIGKKFGLNPIFTLLCVFIGLKIGGVVGIIIVPLTVIVIIGYYKREMSEEN